MAKQLTPREKYDAEKLLSLTGTYDKKSLKKSYLDQVREWHPDVAAAHGHTADEAEEMTKRINNAFVALMTQFDGDVATIQCEPSPDASASAGPSATRGATAGASRQASTGGHARGDGGNVSGSASPDPATDQGPYGQAYAPAGRGATPRDMDAAVRYTRIVTDSSYVKWFVSGIGPHVVWAAASLAFLLACGVMMTGVFGGAGIAMCAQLLPIFVVYDVATGRGAELVLSVADIWAVNKAVRG